MTNYRGHILGPLGATEKEPAHYELSTTTSVDYHGPVLSQRAKQNLRQKL